MKIELTEDLPIDKKHGCVKGRQFEVTGARPGRKRLYYFYGDTGERCGAFSRECKVVTK